MNKIVFYRHVGGTDRHNSYTILPPAQKLKAPSVLLIYSAKARGKSGAIFNCDLEWIDHKIGRLTLGMGMDYPTLLINTGDHGEEWVWGINP